jgi:hypothetical protein
MGSAARLRHAILQRVVGRPMAGLTRRYSLKLTHCRVARRAAMVVYKCYTKRAREQRQG